MAAAGDLPTTTLATLCFLSAAILLAAARPSDAPPRAEAEVPLWRKYFRNDTLTGRAVACSSEEKFCLQRGMLLHAASGKCFLWGRTGACEALSDAFRVDKAEFRATGRVRGACVNRDLCGDSSEYKMAADGSCRYMGEVSEICYGQTGIGTSEDLFGETECACTYGPCPDLEKNMESPPQNLAEDQCVVPNLRNTELPSHSWDTLLSTPRSEVPCTETERRCFLDGRLYHAAQDLCFGIWQQGPCEDGQWFVLDREEAINGSGKVQGICQSLPCGPGRVKSAVDGGCVTERELCGGGYPVTYNVAGAAACTFFQATYDNMRLPTFLKADGVCGFQGADGWPSPPVPSLDMTPPPPPPACPESKTGYCDRDVEKPRFQR